MDEKPNQPHDAAETHTVVVSTPQADPPAVEPVTRSTDYVATHRKHQDAQSALKAAMAAINETSKAMVAGLAEGGMRVVLDKEAACTVWSLRNGQPSQAPAEFHDGRPVKA